MANEMNFRSIKEVATRADFPALMNVGMKTAFMEKYNNAESEFEDLVTFETSTKAKETYPTISSVEDPDKVLEGEEFPEKNVGALDTVDITNYKFGRIMAITREMVDDDQTAMIKNQPAKQAQAHINRKNRLVFSTIVNGTAAATCYDGLAIFTTNHYNRTGGAAQANNDNVYTAVTLSAGALIIAMDMINLWKGLDDDDISVMPRMIVVPWRLGFTARWLMSQTAGIPSYAANVLGPASAQAQTNGKGPIDVMLPVKVCKWLRKVAGAGTALDWYLWTNVPGWVFQVRDPIEVTAEGNLSKAWFEREVMRWKTRERYGFKNIDWRSSILIS